MAVAFYDLQGPALLRGPPTALTFEHIKRGYVACDGRATATALERAGPGSAQDVQHRRDRGRSSDVSHRPGTSTRLTTLYASDTRLTVELDDADAASLGLHDYLAGA